MPAFKYGTQYRSIMKPEDAPWTAMGTTGQYQDMFGLVEPEDNTGYLNLAQGMHLHAQDDLAAQKFDLLKSLYSGALGHGGGGGGGQIQIRGGSTLPGGGGGGIPAPQYASYAPVYSQGQVDAQSNLQRSNLLAQANNSNRLFSQQMGQAGFSPMSPFAMLNAQSGIMRANAGAAANETNLNFQAAGANSDARLKTAGINAGIYGDYARALAQQNQTNSDYNVRSQGLRNDYLGMLLRGLA